MLSAKLIKIFIFSLKLVSLFCRYSLAQNAASDFVLTVNFAMMPKRSWLKIKSASEACSSGTNYTSLCPSDSKRTTNVCKTNSLVIDSPEDHQHDIILFTELNKHDSGEERTEPLPTDRVRNKWFQWGLLKSRNYPQILLRKYNSKQCNTIHIDPYHFVFIYIWQRKY